MPCPVRPIFSSLLLTAAQRPHLSQIWPLSPPCLCDLWSLFFGLKYDLYLTPIVLHPGTALWCLFAAPRRSEQLVGEEKTPRFGDSTAEQKRSLVHCRRAKAASYTGSTMEEPEELPYQLIREITDGFSEKRKVGQGGFGTVYKGVTKTGVDVAVKILRDGIYPDLDFKQFKNEFDNLKQVKHVNIVQFLGYCYEIKPTCMAFDGRIVRAEETNKALCFEYLHNGSLQNHLSEESCGLDWHTRYKIIKGICEGLRYIHEEKSLLHLDLKPDNILLDNDMVPKIADFGLSKIFGDELTRDTQISFGTFGYKPPEYIDKKEISKKFDIFSLGVIIIRIVSGSEGYPKCLGMASREFIEQVQRNWKKRCQACSNGFLLEACYNCRQVETCIQIAFSCLEEDSQKRPDIDKIIDKLEEIESDNCKETQNLQPTENVPKTDCGMPMHNETKQAKEHNVITDEHQYSNIRSRSNEIEQTVGRDKEKKKIVASLLECIKSEKMVILPIYGIGGIGKTTLARLICDDTNFKYYSHVWVYVSQRFDLMKIHESIMSELSVKENAQSNEQLIRNGILIVLDDLWEEDPLKIEKLKNDMLNLVDGIQKTVVLVTTRSADIAQRIQRNIEPYQIRYLTDEMCWDIMKQKSEFEARHDKEKFVDLGKEIAQKCRGVALAAKTLGSMLRSMKHDEWMTVEKSDLWNETISEDTSLPQHVLASLKLSYAFSMDEFLKECFTYCAIFPKGHKIKKNDLIYQWISLGFVKQRRMLSSLQVGEKYIMRLLGLDFLQPSVLSPATYPAYDEHDTFFTMHDLVHDLAISLLGDKILDQSKQGNSGGRSYCYALLTDCSKPLESSVTSPGRLSALHFLDCWRTELQDAAIEPAKFLHVLDLSECSINNLPDSIGQLKKLGYLNAPTIRDEMVPECITKLSNLRYLSLRGSWAIQALPDSIGELQVLVYFDLSGCCGIRILPESFGDLKSLEHLDFKNCENIIRVSQCLSRLTKLQHLNLSGCKKIADEPIALGSLTELQYLNLSNSSYLSTNKHAEAAFLVSLTKLRYLNLSTVNPLHSIKLPEALGSLTELKYLNVSGHANMQKLPASFGKLCNLVHLDLSLCYHLQGVQSALNGLTKLQYLNLYKCTGFDPIEGQQEVLGNLSELRHLNIGHCNAMRSPTHPDKINGRLRQICTLTNLQSLNLSCNDGIYSIPETLSNLRKLHTLDLSSCIKLKGLPTSISEIESLKIIKTRGCGKLPQHNTSHGGSSNYPFRLKYVSSDQLEISRLENVKLAKEAETIKLVEKTLIARLTLEWTSDAKRFVDDAEVLKELVVPRSVSEFQLKGYNSVSFPPWVMRLEAYLPGLTSIMMSDLPSCNNLPPLGQLPKLKHLEIRRMESIKKIHTDFYGGTRAFPRLEWFSIHGMEFLEDWNTAYTSDEDGLNEPVFPCLKHVEISHCPRLKFKPRPPRSYSVPEVMLSSWSNKVLKHVDCLDLEYHGVEHCVVKLRRRNSLGHLPCLEHLSIRNCRDLNLACSSPDFLRGLSSLRVLTVSGWESIASLEWLRDLTSLTDLKITDCNSIKTLPDSIQLLTCLQTLTVEHCKSIVTLPDSIQQLTYLQCLNIQAGRELAQLKYKSSDRLEISRLEKVQLALGKEVETIMFMATCIALLTLEWTKDAKRFLDDAEVLSKLVVPHNVSELHLIGYNSVSFPSWVMRIADYLPRLTSIVMSDLPSCNNLPPLGQLPKLKRLEIRRMDSIKKIDWDLYGGTKAFPELQHFLIDGMKCLEEWNMAYSSDKDSLNEPVFPCLKHVEIRHCPRLRIKARPPSFTGVRVHTSDEVLLLSWLNRVLKHVESLQVDYHDMEYWEVKLFVNWARWFTYPPCLEHLSIRNCTDLNLACRSPDFLQGLSSPRFLTINGWESVDSLEWLGDLTSLTDLIIDDNSIETLPDSIQQLTRLQTLIISHCESKMSLPEWLGDLTSLRYLEISSCTSIKTLPNSIKQLYYLRTLTISYCESIESLPEGLGDLTSLKELMIFCCKHLKSLPDNIQKLTLLQTLTVSKCKSIVSLPERLGDLTSLTYLDISDCRHMHTPPNSIEKLIYLQTLAITYCETIVSLPEWLGDLTSLMKLKLWACYGIKVLPDSIQQLTLLQTLNVSCCSIVSLPERLGDLKSLTELDIRVCRSIKTLPDSIQKLTSLQRLVIDGCPELVEWCESEENKMKLVHIKERIFRRN